MRLEHHLVGGYVRYISPYIIIIISIENKFHSLILQIWRMSLTGELMAFDVVCDENNKRTWDQRSYAMKWLFESPWK